MFWAFNIAYANPLHVAIGGSTFPESGYTVNTAVFDGTNDWIRSTTGDTGWNDTTGATASFWYKPSTDGTVRFIFSYCPLSATEHLSVWINASNQLRFRASNSTSASGSAVDLTSSVTVTTGNGWYHIFWAVNTGSPSDTQLWVNGVEDTSLTEPTLSGTMDLTITGDRTTVGGNTGSTPSQLLSGSIAELWINDTYLSPATNLSKFYSSGSPVNLGTNGTTPTGSQPCIYFSGNGSGDSWTSQGSAGDNWTANSTLGTDTSP